MAAGALLKEAFFAFSYELALFIEGRQGFTIGATSAGLARQQLVLKLCKQVREHCFPYWVDWMTRKTMAQVDRQAASLRQQWSEGPPQPIFTEVTEGETPLGGEMRLHHDFMEGTDQAS